MSKRTDEILFLENSPNHALTHNELRQLILGGAIGPAIRVRTADDLKFQAIGVRSEFRPLFSTLTSNRFFQGQAPQSTWFIWLLLGMIARMYTLGLNGEWHWQIQGVLMNDYASAVELGEWHRIWTAAFIHQSLTHVSLNAAMLGYLGFQIERRFGPLFLAWVVVLSTALGSLCSLILDPHSASIGCSAAVYALLTLSVGLGLRDRHEPESVSEHFGWFVLPYLVLAFVMGLLSPNTDHAGHFGGFVVGAVFACFYPNHQSNARRTWVLTALMSGLLICVLMVFSWKGTAWTSMVVYHDDQGLHIERPSHWKAGWGSTGARAWLSPTVNAQLVVESIIHTEQVTDPRPLLFQHLEQMGTIQSVDQDEPNRIGGASGWIWKGVVQQVDGDRAVWMTVLCRGLIEHYIILTASIEHQEGYGDYWVRIMNSTHLELPKQLQFVSERVRQPDASLAELLLYAEAKYQIGHLPTALDAFEQILQLNPSSIEAMVGRLRCLQGLEDPALPHAVNEALPWIGLSETLARRVVPLLSREQFDHWLPLLHAQYPDRLWIKALTPALE